MGIRCDIFGHKWKTTHRKKIENLVYTIQCCQRCGEERAQSHTDWDYYGRKVVDIDWLKHHMTPTDRVDD